VDDATVAELFGSRAAAFAPGSRGFLVQQMVEGLDANNDGVQETPGVADIIRQQDGNILGRTSVYLEGRRTEVRVEETNLGNLSSDANLFYAKQFDARTAVSIKNGGGIRDSIGSFSATGGSTAELPPAANPSAGKQAGDISQLDVANSLRFNNGLSLVTVTASELERILEHGVSATAPGATPGQFPQVGGIQFSFDASRQAQTLNAQGQVTREGQRIQSAAIVDENGVVLDVLVRDGQVVGDPNREIRVVTLDFLASPSSAAPGLGGDNYPFPAFGENRVDLRTATGNVPNAATFAPQGSEQDALAEFLRARFSTNPFNQVDTGPAGDTRISNLGVRSDAALNSAPVTGTAGADAFRSTAGNDIFDGGAGIDSISFNETFASVTVSRQGNSIVIQGPDGRDAVRNVETFIFSDAVINQNQGGGRGALVDDLFYFATNLDVFAARQNPEEHYVRFGAAEGRDPNAFFDTRGYLSANPDVARSGINPVDHYLQAGGREGRDPAANFDNEQYLLRNPDVARAGQNPLEHYLLFGQAEGRQAFAAIGPGANIAANGFDREYYLLVNDDVGRAGVDPLAHYNAQGFREGRNPNAFFDTSAYLATYTDVRAAGRQPARPLSQRRLPRGSGPRRPGSTPRSTSRPTATSAAAGSTRCCISSSSAPTRAGRPSTTARC
jgi:hypothetical protein